MQAKYTRYLWSVAYGVMDTNKIWVACLGALIGKSYTVARFFILAFICNETKIVSYIPVGIHGTRCLFMCQLYYDLVACQADLGQMIQKAVWFAIYCVLVA